MAQVVSQDSLILQRRKWKDNGQCVVVVAGCFDLLHPGHVRLLEQARSHGDILVVGVQSDASARASFSHPDGTSHSAASPVPRVQRPVTPAPERAEILAALAAVDYVVEFDEASPDRLIEQLSPDIVVKGASSFGGQDDPADDTVSKSVGPKVVCILLEPGYSTTRLLERITQPIA